jgi:hypothetical protein
MSRRINRIQQSELARAMALGRTVTDWAEENQVNRRTAYRWAESRAVRDEVDEVRRRTLDEAIGRLSGKVTKAAEQITCLAEAAQSEAVRLQASRAILTELMTASSHAALARRLAEIERRLTESSQVPACESRHDPAGLYPPTAGDAGPGEEDGSCPAS